MSGQHKDSRCIGCHRSDEGDYWCPRFGGWRERCPVEEREADGRDADCGDGGSESEVRDGE